MLILGNNVDLIISRETIHEGEDFTSDEVIENVHIKASCSPDEIITYTSLFKEFRDIFF